MASREMFAVAIGALMLTACNNSAFKGRLTVNTFQPKYEREEASHAAEAVIEDEAPASSPGENPAPPVPPKPKPEPEPIADRFTITQKMDIVFAIHTSASLSDELLNLQTNLPVMLKTLTQSNVDFRIHFMLGTPMTVPAGTDPSRVAFVRKAIDSISAISMLGKLLAGEFAASYFDVNGKALTSPLSFRREARLEVVVMSDDDGYGDGNHASDLLQNPRYSNATYNGIIGLPSSEDTMTCSVSLVGHEYMALAKQSVGTTLDICSVDWVALVTKLSNDIVKHSDRFLLSRNPVDPKAIQVKVGDQVLQAKDWTYDLKNNFVILDHQFIKEGAELSISYKPIR